MAARRDQSLNELSKTVRSQFPNFVLGVIVLIVLVLAIVGATQNQRTKPATNSEKKEETSALSQLREFFQRKPTPTPKPEVKAYVVREGDHLWSIAQATYGSGFNAYDIAKANKIENPDLIVIGQKLILPNVKPGPPTKGEISAAQTQTRTSVDQTYAVQQGDHLWSIAQKAYGDPFQWVKIAQANNLTNPDLIHPGTKLTLPKN